MITETAPRKPLKTGHLGSSAAPSSQLRLEQVRWCPQCRRYRGPGGRFLAFQTVRRLTAVHRAEARRIEAEQAVALTFGPRISEDRARQSAATLFGTPAPVIRQPATATQARTARTVAILFDTPMPTTPSRSSRADARAAKTAQLLFA